jgi:raffinose/stachyose/melibiose transport system substrate-binding protein
LTTGYEAVKLPSSWYLTYTTEETPMALNRRSRAVLALLATPTLLFATTACLSKKTETNTSGCDTTTQSANLYKNPVTLTWWHNYNVPAADPVNKPGGLEYWQKVANDFHALHPTVTIQITAVESNSLQREKIPAALKNNQAPDLFQAWGGGEIADQAASGYVKDITGLTKDQVANIGAAASIWSANGCQYGLPFRMGIEGIFYNKALFAQAGITSTPKTMDDLNAAVTKLKAIHVTPIAVAAGDGWPAAHWWYQFAIHDCTPAVLASAQKDKKFDDPCFVKAGDDLKTFVATNPFQPDFLGTKFGSGTSPSGALINARTAAMELMGDWDEGTINGLSADGKGIGADLGWFPVPALGSGGDPTVQLGGGDGFACSKNAPAECVEFLKYIVSPEVQLGYAKLGVGIPVSKGAGGGITDPVIASIAQATNNATSVQLWLDTQYGSAIGDAMNAAIVKIFNGTGSSQDVVTAIKTAAAR